MNEWELVIKNIGGIKDEKSFQLKQGLNVIYGQNASGKTTIINSLKLLNNLENFYEGKDSTNDITLFLHRGEISGKIELKNENHKYFIEISQGFLQEKPDKLVSNIINFQIISKDPNIINFAFIDKDNQIMKSIEYNGNIKVLTNEILKISKIKQYEKIREIANKLFIEYQSRKDEQLKGYHYKRKEIELRIQKNEDEIKNLEIQIEEIQSNLGNMSESANIEIDKLSKEKKSIKDEINKVKNNKIDTLISEIQKISIKKDKIESRLKSAQRKRLEIEKYKNTENFIFEFEKDIQNLELEIKNITDSLKKDKDSLYEKKIKRELLENTLESHIQICPHCLNNINKEIIEQYLKNLDKEFEELNSRIKELKDSLEKKQNDKNVKNQKIMELKKFGPDQKELMINIEKDKKSLSSNKIELDHLSKEKKIYDNNLKNLKENLRIVNENLINLTSVNKEIKEKQEDLTKKINFLKEKNDEYIEIRANYIRKIILIPQNYDKLLKKVKFLIDELDNFIDDYFYAFIDKINADIEKLIKILNWSFKTVKINDDLEIKIYNNDNIPLDFWSLSGFERKSIAILILLIIKNQFYPEYPLFAIDEHLDSADNERFLNFINFLQKNVISDKIKLFLVTINKLNSEIVSKNPHRTYNGLEIIYME